MKFSTEYSGPQINIRHLLAYLLDKALLLILSIIIFAVAFTAAGILRNSNTETADPQAILEGYRNRLTEEEANAVEGLFIHYDMCMNYLYGYYGNMKCMKNAYRFETDNLNAELLSEMLLICEEDYNRISDIYGLEDRNIHKAYERIGFKIISDKSDGENEAAGVTVFVSVYGKDDDECRKVMAVIESGLAAVERSLDTGDRISGPELIGSVVTYGESSFMKESPDETVEGLVNIGNVLSGVTSASNWFSDDQKVYFNALRDNRKGKLGGAQSDGSSGISMKYPVLGAVCGLVISAGALVMIYLCNGKIKTNEDVSSRYGVEVTEPVSFAVENKLFFHRWADKLRGQSTEMSEVNSVAAVDSIIQSLKENGIKKAVLLRSESPASIKMAERVKNDVHVEGTELIEAGDPNGSAEALKMIEAADTAVVIVELDSTKQDTVDRWLSLCRRYKTSLAGIITVFSK